ncbi:hypothetical protein LY39_00714 [Roseinatronobacter bogoriensis subsp. barguzinensis]|nr:hypothetical protein [Rhodobaca bogoriensis DSM 18756]TDW41607.1 hypothetical protein LY39_00714 [Rhodobaca barguzinensis]TDY74214.1 hypothetical protein EV660_101250 [Rhodobaca bogoriensis DSM 18756]
MVDRNAALLATSVQIKKTELLHEKDYRLKLLIICNKNCHRHAPLRCRNGEPMREAALLIPERDSRQGRSPLGLHHWPDTP